MIKHGISTTAQGKPEPRLISDRIHPFQNAEFTCPVDLTFRIQGRNFRSKCGPNDNQWEWIGQPITMNMPPFFKLLRLDNAPYLCKP